MIQIESVAKKLDDAIDQGLKKLGVTIDEVKIEIIEQGGFFRKAKVLLTLLEDEGSRPYKAAAEREEHLRKKAEQEKAANAANKDKGEIKKAEKPAKQDKQQPVKKEAAKESAPEKKKSENVKKDNVASATPAPEKKKEGFAANNEKKAQKPNKNRDNVSRDDRPQRPLKPVDEKYVGMTKDFLNGVLTRMNIEAEVLVDISKGSIDADIKTTDSAVIGHRGEVLDSLQIMLKRVLEDAGDGRIRVNIDSQNYREKREQALVGLAKRQAEKCIRTGRKVVLEPMNNNYRKVIHSVLSENDKIITKSEGREPNRRVVIIPKS